MENFLKSIEAKAYRMALYGSGQQSEALDLVQESMLRFVEKYADKPQEEWPALFFRVLQNQIRDFHRRQYVRKRWMIWFSGSAEENDWQLDHADSAEPDPEQQLLMNSALKQLQTELMKLPLRQQQTFLLRAWEGLSVADTAIAMKCSQGAVKTHYFRALERLKKRLGDFWP
ncbi:MAG: RNA polymerase sigma factor [Pelovirga sp.]